MGKLNLKRLPKPPKPPKLKDPMQGINRARMNFVTVLLGFVVFATGFIILYKNIERMLPKGHGSSASHAAAKKDDAHSSPPADKSSTNHGAASQGGGSTAGATGPQPAAAEHKNAGPGESANAAAPAAGHASNAAPQASNAPNVASGQPPAGDAASAAAVVMPASPRVKVETAGPVCYRYREGLNLMRHPNYDKNQVLKLFREALNYKPSSDDAEELQCQATVRSYLKSLESNGK